ncbi:N-6 DNA methylase [Micromonospora sp. WMMD812]|uniref:restriction endonuclease subunit M n=1 Tax=Micromonospora sp. WMMD812 TaxID=3015152 RepID=UPI00248C8D47|nr:N-6 DNA methylase [Micromonospora sp. WMMD812]WBB65746.1 N-6 DNA methylase [Micromonospora sp. WMMD812]
MVAGLTLVCPVRGRLKAKSRSADGLKPSEERLRVEAIRYLIARGYPKENIRVEAVIKRFGNSGRNSFRADIVVLNRPVASLPSDDIDRLLSHAVVLVEVKRENSAANAAKAFQVLPMLDFAQREDCVAMYWDDVEQRVYWHTRHRGVKKLHEGPASDLPGPGQKPGATRLTFDSLDPDRSLLDIFSRIEDILHSASIGPSKRFKVMLQLLLAKLYDEHEHSTRPDSPLELQDFGALEVDPATALSVTNKVLKRAVTYYQKFLPEPVEEMLPLPGPVLVDVMKLLAPIKVVAMKQSVIQDFYMYFARHIYKWDLAQYFTPTTVTEFVVEILNPRFSEHVKDPACGSADFLTAAFRRGQEQGWPDYASSIWGADISPEAVQVAVINMILNGDGKTNIYKEDSLLKIRANVATCDVVICNPPFGTSIVEKNPETLENFDLGHHWQLDGNGRWVPGESLLDKQETGILFAEACVQLLRPSGRLALVVPNGYLGNRSARYSHFREWLLRNCRVAAIIGLPRFTFKGSGADVSASLIFCEKRESPLARASDSEDYDVAVEVIERVGWTLGDKRGAPLYKRDAADGTLVLDEDGDPILDAEFGDVLARIRASDAGQFFDWLNTGLTPPAVDAEAGWTISVRDVLDDANLTLDPKRHCKKFSDLRTQIQSKRHFRLGDVVTFIPEGTTVDGARTSISPESTYRHVEIADVGVGTYRWHDRLGWELPSRARHLAAPGDIFVGSIWSSVTKWFLAGEDCANMIVTNGFHRMRIRPECDELVLDLVVGLCSEAYATQMRGLARGSDGLAEIALTDLAEVLLPRIEDEELRKEVSPFVAQLVAGFTTIEAKVSALSSGARLPIPRIAPRADHTSII